MSDTCIAVATDFSPRADRALDRGKLLAEEMDAKLCLIHATNLPSDEIPDIGALERKMRMSSGLNEKAGKIEFHFPAGSVPRAITDLCENEGASLLVIGPARYNSLGDFFLGTAVDYVLRHTTKPVLVVKNRAHGPYRQIVAGTDFSPGSAHAILTAARMFPEARIHLVHAWHVPFEAWNQDAYVAEEIERDEREKMEKFKAELARQESALADATTELLRGGASDALKKGLELDSAALVVLGSHGTSGFKQAAIGSVTSDLLRILETDTLVVRGE